MKKYSLGESELVNKFISEFNSLYTPDFKIGNVSGITLNKSNDFKSVIEYFELDMDETVNIQDMVAKCKTSIILSNKTSLPFYIIYYIKNQTVFHIYDYYSKQNFEKSFTTKDQYTFSDFILWWHQIKGTIQTKKFYKPVEYSSWKINEVLESNYLKWGGDIDGVITNKSGDILGIIEFRKSSYKKISQYDPAMYYRGTQMRSGDYLTWLPLVKLSKLLNKKLFLITLSMIDGTKCGLTVVLDNDEYHLHYENNSPPNTNIFNTFQEAYKEIIKIIKDNKE